MMRGLIRCHWLLCAPLTKRCVSTPALFSSGTLCLSYRSFALPSLNGKRNGKSSRSKFDKEAEEAELARAFEAIKAEHQARASTRQEVTSSASSSSSPPAPTPASTSAAVEDQLRSHAEHLARELRHSQEVIRQLISLVDRDKHAAELEKLGQTMEGGGGLFIAEDSEALLKGLRTPGARIVLLENHAYLLDLFEPIRITHTSVSIIGNGATIVGSLALDKGATLDASNVYFYAPNGDRQPQLRLLPPGTEPRVLPNAVPESEKPADAGSNARLLPILSATNGSRLFVHDCKLVNGRDGVYLGINSTAELCHTSVLNCIRGVYEGVGCHVGIAPDCVFGGNYFQLVLLGREKHARLRSTVLPSEENNQTGLVFRHRCAPEEVCPPGFRCATPVWLRDRRADVVLEQDPIHDLYSDCWLDGKPVELDEQLCTACLSDPVY